MKLTQLVFSIIFMSSAVTFGQKQFSSTKDSIHHFYDELFNTLQENYLYTKDVDWASVKAKYKKQALSKSSFDESLNITPALFAEIKGDHTLLFAKDTMYQSNLKKEVTQKQFHKSLLTAYANNPSFKVEVLQNNYGYIFVPGMLMLNANKEDKDRRSQEMYDAIIKVANIREIKGWIIDLRLNIGGNANVMLAGLYHLLGDHTVYLGLDTDKNIKTRTGLYQGALYENHRLLTEAKTSIDADTKTPVALVTGIMTGSAGEFVAMGFRGRDNVLIIGEESYGLTTSNDLFELPFDTKAAITLMFATDRSAKYTPSIKPDISIIREANFEDLTKDKNVIEGIKFIDSVSK